LAGRVSLEVLADACLGGAGNLDWIEMATRFSEHCRKPVSILPDDLTDLVTFTEVEDPKSVAAVHPFHLAPTLGTGVSCRSKRLEVTDERLTKGIDDDLSWVRSYDRSIQVPGVKSFNSLQNYIHRGDCFLEK
jgi:hypothetical protein